MNRWFVLAGALMLAIVLTTTADAQGDKDKKVPTIKQIMKTANAGKNCLKAKYEKAFEDKNWDDAAKIAKDWEACAENLVKNKPAKGDKEDWEKASNAYTKAVKTIAEATGKKEEKPIQTALGYIGTSCKKCHSAHK